MHQLRFGSSGRVCSSYVDTLVFSLTASPFGKNAMLDEPTSGTPCPCKHCLMSNLHGYHLRDGTTILISHDMEQTAQELVERVVLMGEGRGTADR